MFTNYNIIIAFRFTCSIARWHHSSFFIDKIERNIVKFVTFRQNTQTFFCDVNRLYYYRLPNSIFIFSIRCKYSCNNDPQHIPSLDINLYGPQVCQNECMCQSTQIKDCENVNCMLKLYGQNLNIPIQDDRPII